MHALGTIAAFFRAVFTPIQLMLFVAQPSAGRPLWRSYMSAWKRTLSFFRAAIVMLFVGDNDAERKMSIAAFVWAGLCIPGVVIVDHALNLMK
jgi:hypothetical protein